jgi:hypothetical protein
LWPGYYDVVVLPPVSVQTDAIVISRQLHKLGGNWALGTRAFIPHISLYHIPVREADFGAFCAELRSIVSNSPFGKLDVMGFDMPVLTISKPDWLDNLQRRIVRRTVKYWNRDYGVESTWGLRFFSGRRLAFARTYLRRYGTPMFGMNFQPHITLTSFDKAPPADFEPEVKRRRFDVAGISVCELGESHSCQRVLARFPAG